LRKLPLWKSVLWIFSYILLVPGIVCPFFRCSVAYTIMGIRWGLFSEPPDFDPTMELSILSFAGRLWSQSLMACMAVMFFAASIPLAKLALVIWIEKLSRREGPGDKQLAVKLLTAVHLMSKWVCTDVMGYLLVVSLYRDLQTRTGVEAESQLDVGFICFSLSCLCTSLLATTHGSGLADFSIGPLEPVSPADPSKSRELLRIAAGLSGLFLPLLYYGFCSTCLEMSTSLSSGFALELSREKAAELGLNTPEEMLPPLLMPFKGLVADTEDHLMSSLVEAAEQHMFAGISLWRCIASAASWVMAGDMASILAVTLFTFFVLVFVVADMVVLTMAAWQWHTGRPVQKCLSWARVLKRAAMLDVCIVSVALMRWAGNISAENGGKMDLQLGFLAIVGAEVIHSALFYKVTSYIGAPADRGGIPSLWSVPRLTRAWLA